VAGASDVPSEFERHLIAFSLHGEHYGLPIASVREIIRYTPPRVTATARGPVRGMINLRGLVLPVLDLSERLGATLAITEVTRILVIEVQAGVLGLIVDGVDGVMHVPAGSVSAIPGAGDDALGSEIAAVDERLIMLVDPDRALGHVLSDPASRRADEPAGDPDLAPQRAAPERPSGPPPSRRRSGATPQVPRRRRQRQSTEDTDQ
jgi:purine-binding chemotaxis protein CheW